MSRARMPLIDAIKAIASQLIVLHHLSAYGPLSEALAEVLPELSGWLFEYGRVAVQAFLVVGGFLAARALAPNGIASFRSPFPLIARRYLRLAIPYLAAISAAVIFAAIARLLMTDDAIPDAPTLPQWAAHALLLQTVLDYDSLSAGVWYIAIDFQLFALFALVLWLGRQRYLPWLGAFLALGLGMAALFYFNRDTVWDKWAIYFFGSYMLGAAAWWASTPGRLYTWLGVIAVVAIAALEVDFRLRLLIALLVALALAFSRRTGLLKNWPESPVLAYLGRISYSVFLIHFPLCLIVNGLFLHFGNASPFATGVGMLGAWMLALLAGSLFYHYVEAGAVFGRLTDRIESAVITLLRGKPVEDSTK